MPTAAKRPANTGLGAALRSIRALSDKKLYVDRRLRQPNREGALGRAGLVGDGKKLVGRQLDPSRYGVSDPNRSSLIRVANAALST